MTAWSVVPPVALLVLVLMLGVLRRCDALTAQRAVVAAIACVYGGGIVANTVFPIYVGDRVSVPQSWTVYLNLVPLVNTEPRDMVANVVVFAPLGVLLPLLVRVRSTARVVLVGFVLSLVMELVQLINAVTGHGGHVADVNDLLANTIGAPLGYVAFRLALMVPVLARAARAGTWPGAASAPG